MCKGRARARDLVGLVYSEAGSLQGLGLLTEGATAQVVGLHRG